MQHYIVSGEDAESIRECIASLRAAADQLAPGGDPAADLLVATARDLADYTEEALA